MSNRFRLGLLVFALALMGATAAAVPASAQQTEGCGKIVQCNNDGTCFSNESVDGHITKCGCLIAC